LSAAQESLQHELNFHQAEVTSLSNANQRYLDLYNDNLRLKASIDELESLYHKETHSHAIQMHQLNRERKDIRKNMEDKLRKDLVCQSSLFFVTHIVNIFFLTVGLTIGWIRNSFSAASL
jgi:hypothetical protein